GGQRALGNSIHPRSRQTIGSKFLGCHFEDVLPGLLCLGGDRRGTAGRTLLWLRAGRLPFLGHALCSCAVSGDAPVNDCLIALLKVGHSTRGVPTSRRHRGLERCQLYGQGVVCRQRRACVAATNPLGKPASTRWP